MKLHEYQAKELFRSVGIPTLKGFISTSPEETVAKANELGYPCVVKAQVHAGGRGKAGGVKLCKNSQDVDSIAKSLLGKQLVTYQTDAQGVPVHKLLVEQGCDIGHEFYLAALIDRVTSSVVIMASREGGVDIEKVAADTPEKIIKVHVDPFTAHVGYQARTLAYGLDLNKDLHASFTELVKNVAKLFVNTDASLLEINPLVLTKGNQWIALDGKMDIDGNAIYRQKKIAEYHDPSQENAKDVEAAKWNLNYIHLDGNIGCMVNGAGLAMATMDMIKLSGGEPANFLDVGGGANADMVREAFKIIVSDPKVEGIFVNIFGGIMKCDVLAIGIVEAVKQVGLKIPLVVRLEGTNVEEGKRILAGAGIQASSNMHEAATMAVKSVKGA